MTVSSLLRSVLARVVRLWAPAILLTAAAAGAAPTVGLPEVVLHESDESVTVLEFVFPLQRDAGEPAPLVDSDLDWVQPQPMIPGPDGEPVPGPRTGCATVAVPTRGALGWEIVDSSWIVEPRELVTVREAVRIGSPRVHRNVPLATVVLTPELGGGVLGSVTVRLRHAPQGRYATALSLKTAPPTRADAGLRAVLNPDLYRALQAGLIDLARRDKADGRQGETPFERSDNWLRVDVAETGVHVVTGFDFTLAGVIGQLMADVDSHKLRVFRAWPTELPDDPEVEPGTWQADYAGLSEVACEVVDFDNNWDSADRILFYAVGPDDWADRYRDDAEALEWQQHPYDDHTAYWITWEDHQTATPHPGDPLRVAVHGAAASGATPVDIHQGRIHREEDRVEAFGRLLDNWAWDTAVDFTRAVDFEVADAVTDSAAFFVMELRMYHRSTDISTVESTAAIWLNDGDQTGESVVRTWNIRTETHPDSLRFRITGWSNRLLDGANALTLERLSTTSSDPWLMLDSADLMSWRRLHFTTGQYDFIHWGRQVQTAGQTVDLALGYDSGSAPRIWDVSDPVAPTELDGTVAGAPTRTVTLSLTRAPDTDVHLIAFKSEDLLAPIAVTRRTPGTLRSIDPAVDYVIVYHPDFVDDVRRLEANRARTRRTLSASVDEIYDAFGGGVKDPLALRNFLKWLYVQGDGALEAVCLFGDASRDYRDRYDQLEDLVPTVIRSSFPSMISQANRPYASDDHLVSFDRSIWSLDHPDLALGRLTVRDAQQARRRVDALIDYDQVPPPGTWRNRVVMAADDFCQPSDVVCTETMHMRQAEILANETVPLSVDVGKLYLVDYAYDPGGTFKPQARQEARRLWNEGLAIFHYIGHGSENTLADEQVFLTDDIYGLTNGGRRGVFAAFSCDVGVYDSPTRQSMAEIFVDQENGGAIASIAASQVSYVGGNNNLSTAFYQALYPDRRVDADMTLGQALLAAKIAMDPSDLPNSQRYLLFGDPMTSLPTPAAGPEFHASSADTLRGGWREEVVCVLSDYGLSAGAGTSYDLVVHEDREVKVATEDATSFTYWLPGATVFHGTGSALGDTLRVPFKVPVQIRYGAHGKVRLMIDAPEGGYAVARELPVAQAATGVVDDLVGPVIDLAFADDRYRVKPGTLLRATVSDTSGVSILGTTPLNSVLLVLDDSDFASDVSESFTFDPGSYTTGSMEIPLPDNLAFGDHTAALKASDVLGNVGTDSLSFQLVAGDQVAIDDVTLFPNPTAGPARLIFELSDPMTVRWSIYTTAGHRVYTQTRHFGTAGPQVLHWDGRDDAGDELANGVYLFVLKGTGFDDEGHQLDVTGKLVVMK